MLKAVQELRASLFKEHEPIIFNGNNYAASWVTEAERRGLLNLRSTVDALPSLIAEKNIRLFTTHKIFSETEIRARYEISLEGYTKVLNIEAETMLTMAQREILPAVMKYTGNVAQEARRIKDVSPELTTAPEEKLLTRLTTRAAILSDRIDALQEAIVNADHNADALTAAVYEHDVIIPAMNDVRAVADELETMVSKADWPFPTYAELLFNV